jgi:hypothetical protein
VGEERDLVVDWRDELGGLLALACDEHYCVGFVPSIGVPACADKEMRVVENS